MRFIDLELVRPRIADLLDALQRAHDAVMAETDPDRRAELIQRNQPRWAALRERFSAVSHGKCWYVECRDTGADNDVDHFRPKLGVDEDPFHPGYYWLAFDWRNMRLSCQRANRPRRDRESGETGGKAAHFPLIDAGTRAHGPGDDLDREVPSLLDPTRPTDVVLLSFKPNGETDISPEFRGIAIVEAKFEASCRCLHLNWPKFVEARVVRYNTIVRDVERGEREAPSPEEIHRGASAAFRDAIRDLVAAMKPDAEYSAAARVYVESFRHVWWIESIVLKVAA